MAAPLLNRLRPETRTPVLALSAVLVLAVIAFATAPTTGAPPLSIHSSERDGAMALWEWLGQTYTTREITRSAELEGIDALFLLAPVITYSSNDGRLLRDWVGRGHTLIVAGEPFDLNEMLTPFDLSLAYLGEDDTPLSPASPALNAPAFGAVALKAFASIQSRPSALVPHFYVHDQPVLASLTVGRGQIWLMGALYPFTNRGLHDPGSAELIANFLADLPEKAVIGFDEGAHGEAAPQDLTGWLFTSPPGLGILLAFGLTLCYVASRGRRFGQVVPLPENRLRRESAEHVWAMAGLFRRAGSRGEVLKHFDAQLRRRLSERYTVDPGLEPDDLVKVVAYRAPQVDEAALRRLLDALSQADISEGELIRVVSELDHFLRSLN